MRAARGEPAEYTMALRAGNAAYEFSKMDGTVYLGGDFRRRENGPVRHRRAMTATAVRDCG